MKVVETLSFGLFLISLVVGQSTLRGPGTSLGGYGGNTCPPQGVATMESPGRCDQLILCRDGVGTVMDCPSQLLYNPSLGNCDYPDNVPNPKCPVARPALTPQASQLCVNTNRGRREEAYIVAHPVYCNSFVTCNAGYLYNACSFCGENQYFHPDVNACVPIPLGADTASVCGQRQYVRHDEKVTAQLDDNCFYLANVPNPYRAVLENIRNRGNRPTNG